MSIARVPVSVHARNLRQLRCVVSGTDQQIELHHCHGGSMKEIRAAKGAAVKTNPFFQIPLTHKYHTGQFNPEAIGMVTWEEKFGRQLDYLQGLEQLLGYNVFIQAGLLAGDNIRATGANYGSEHQPQLDAIAEKMEDDE